MIITKLYKYDSSQEANGYKGEDFSKYIMLGDSDTDDLTEILDVVELTLAGLPISEEFAPSTKFIYQKLQGETTDIYGNVTGYDIIREWHLCVAEDIVSQPIMSDSQYFDHHITFNEASVIAQKRPVDNISVTYKLKDVDLESELIVDQNASANVVIKNQDNFVPDRDFGYYTLYRTMQTAHGITRVGIGASHYLGRKFEWVFPTWYSGIDPSLNSDISEWYAMKYYQEFESDQTEKQVEFPVPMLKYSEGNIGDGDNTTGSKDFITSGYCSVLVSVYETDLKTGEENVTTYNVNPCSNVLVENRWQISPILTDEADNENVYNHHRGTIVNRTDNPFHGGVWRKRIAEFEDTPTNRRITITTLPNKKYRIVCTLRDLTPSTVTDGGAEWDNEYGVAYHSFYPKYNTPNIYQVNSDTLSATLEFMTLQKTNFKAELHQAPPANAYDLYQKAQINSQNVKKIDGTPINETPMTFYCNEDDVLELQNTQIVEAFYNQKNLWELQLEIGKYIHAIPENRFGKDDRLVTHWRRLGRPNILTDSATTTSIFNSRSIENYISACSSYVNNMVQLGGEIDEWIAPKTTSEEYLVSNDVAELITSKNIIEIIDLEVKAINREITDSHNEVKHTIEGPLVRNLAGNPYEHESSNGYVFEKNIYNLLPIVASEYTNKGLAIYYELGTNVIKGLNYRLPTESTGDIDNEYAIKRILGHAYRIDEENWTYIKVNDFLFHIRYRTKENIRSEQTRPDLRKYLLNSKYDQIPQHKQFNNQTDILVDSVKFGNNVYGKLIKTGNTEYTVVEWVENLTDIKQSGDLYNIRGNLYYVSKVKNTYYKTYVISEVTYSKDYNQLSEIIGIPSEPRFYEISEQSLIERDFAYNKYITLSTDLKNTITQKFTLQHKEDSLWEDIQQDYWQAIIPVDSDNRDLYIYMHIGGLISNIEYNGQELTSYFYRASDYVGLARCLVVSSELNSLAGDNTEIELTFTIDPDNNSAYTYDYYRRKVDNQFNTYIKGLLFEGVDYFPKYAITTFKNDSDRKYGDVPGNERFLVDVCTPIGTFSQQNTLTMSWDMVDNFSAGDYVSETIFGFTTGYLDDPINGAYRELNPVKYTDVYGRSDLVDFAILNNIDFTNENILNLPNSPIRTKQKYVNRYRGTYEFDAVPTIEELNTKLYNADGDYEIYLDDGTLSTGDLRPVRYIDDGNWIEVKITTDGVVSTYIYTYEGDGYYTDGEFIGEWVITQQTQEEINYFNKPSILDNTYSDQVIFSTSNLEKNGLNTSGIGLIKDNREKININYNVQMLTDSDRFVLSSYLWQPGKQDVKLALLTAEINKISTDTIPTNNIIRSIDLPVSDILSITYEPLSTIRIGISTALADVDLTGIKAICITSARSINESDALTKFIIGRNITDLTEEDAKKDWYIRPITDSDIRKQ